MSRPRVNKSRITRISRPKWTREIKVLVWDLDGTLYQQNLTVKRLIIKKCIEAVAKANAISLPQAEKSFSRTRNKLKSNTKTLLKLKVAKEYVMSGDWYNPAQLKSIKKDKRIVTIFQKVNYLRHILNTNNDTKIGQKKLSKLGLAASVFEKIFYNFDFGVIKPEPQAFINVLKYTKLKPSQHLVIGDSEGKEIIPAKKMGMRTCFVWGKSKIADVSLQKVYDVLVLFNN